MKLVGEITVSISHILPQRLRELRKEYGWTLEDVAQIVGVTQRAVASNWEATNHRRRTPDLETLLILAKWYGVSLDYLVGVPGAERDSPAVQLAKRELREALKGADLPQAMTARERAQLAWTTAARLCPDVFFEGRLAGRLLMDRTDLQEVIENGFWSSRLIELLAPFLGLPLKWFHSDDPAKVLHGPR